MTYIRKIETSCEGIKTSHVDALFMEMKTPILLYNILRPSKPNRGKSGRLGKKAFHIFVRVMNTITFSESRKDPQSFEYNAKGAHVQSRVDSLNESTSSQTRHILSFYMCDDSGGQTCDGGW